MCQVEKYRNLQSEYNFNFPPLISTQPQISQPSTSHMRNKKTNERERDEVAPTPTSSLSLPTNVETLKPSSTSDCLNIEQRNETSLTPPSFSPLPSLNLDETPNPLQCGGCNKRFSRAYTLRRHQEGGQCKGDKPSK